MSSLTPMGVQMVADLAKWSPGVSRALSDTEKLDSSFDKVAKSSAQMERGLDDIGGAASRNASAFGELKTMVSGAVAAFALGGFTQAVGDLNSLGIEVTRTSHIFENLAGGTQAAARLMDDMRSSTRGAVDDLNLMAGANRLVAMGLATTAQEAATMTRMAVSLGSAFGRDASTSIEEFSLLLANQSILRLDSFGISGAKVRAEIEKLKEAGMDADQAFRFAVMKEGEASMLALGDAVDASATAFQRLSVRVENAKQDLAEFVSGGIEAGAGILDLIDIMNQANERNAEAASQTRMATSGATAAAYIAAVRQAYPQLGDLTPILSDQGGTNYTPEQYFSELARGAAEFESVMGRAVASVDDLKQGLTLAGSAMANGGFGEGQLQTMQFFLDYQVTAETHAITMRTAYNALLNRTKTLFADINRLTQEQQARQAELAIQGAEEQARLEATLMGGTHGAEIANAIIAQQEAARARLFGGQAGILQSQALRGYLQFMDSGFGATDLQYTTQRQAEAIAQEFRKAEISLEQFKEAFDKGLIKQDELDRAQQLADTLKAMSTDAQNAAAAFQNMRLPEALGQGLQPGQGVLADVSTDVLETLQAQGVDQEALDALKTQFQLATGEETELSQAYQNEVLPRIAEIYQQFGAEAALTASENYAEGLRQARLQGINDDTLLQYLADLTGYAATGQPSSAGAFTIKPGDTLSAIQAQLAASGQQASIEQLLAATGASNPRLIQPGTFNLGGGGGLAPIEGFSAASMMDTLVQDQDKLDAFMTKMETTEGEVAVKVNNINAQLNQIGFNNGAMGVPGIGAGVGGGMGGVMGTGVPVIDNVTGGLDALYTQTMTQVPEINTQLQGTEVGFFEINTAAETLGSEGVSSLQPFFSFVIAQATATVEIIRQLGSELDGLAGAASSVAANTAGAVAAGGNANAQGGIRGFAEGGWTGGVSLVGERGRELIATGDAAYILSNPRTESFLSNLARISGGGGTTNNRTNTMNVYMNNYSEAAYAASQQMQADNLRGF